MASQNVISFERSAGPARQRIAATKAKKLVNDCRGLIIQSLPRLIADLFEKLDDTLYQRTEKTASDSRQDAYFEAMRALRKVRKQVENRFMKQIAGGVDEYFTAKSDLDEASGEAVDSDDKGPNSSLNELSLVDDEELEEYLAVAGIVSKAENRYHRELFALNARFGHLANRDELANSENPIGPNALTESFCAALKAWKGGKFEVKLVVYKLFDRCVMAYVGGLYDELNDVLIAGDVLPRLTQRTVRNPVAPSLRRDSSDQRHNQ
jgi:molybdopterin converting factor small subunit